MEGPRRVGSILFVLGAVLLSTVLATFAFTGRFLYIEDPLERADAVLVFAGTFGERPLEAADLYRAGYAPLIVLTREAPDGGQVALARRGAPMPDRADLARDAIVRLGVPPAAILTLAAIHDSTADEARSFRTLIQARRWGRVIVVTSKTHTRRARMTMNRTCGDLGVKILMRASRYDPSDPAHWWRRRADARSVLFEIQKYVLYWLRATG